MAHSDTVVFPAPRGPQADGGPRRLQDRVPIDAITADARKARPSRAVLALVGGVLFTAGWIVAKSFGVAFLAGAWCFSAAKMGWRTARNEPLDQPSLDEVLAENEHLRKALARVS